MVIDIENVQKHYGKLHVLQDLHLQVPEGAAFALVGTNGAGKTTTMRMLVNILRPDSGNASILGKATNALSHRDFEDIGYVSESQKLPEKLTIEQFFNYLRPCYAKWDKGFEKTLRKNLDLPPERKLGQLSHGMRMKTVLIAALSFRPKLLILDEPLSGLDSLVRDEVIEGLLEQAGETSILISSHELAEIETFITHVAYMNKGKVHFQESIESLKGRFREVAVTLSANKNLPEPLPQGWLSPEITGHSLQLIETDFRDHDTLYQKLSSQFGAVQFDEEPMSLREIFKTLTRQARLEARA